MEFWISESQGSITINDYENPDSYRGDSTLTHPFTGEWVGDISGTKKLRQGLLLMYLKETSRTIEGKEIKDIWLKDLEHNLLQYRLMHSGYSDNFPPKLESLSAEYFSIDGSSMFYDEGYREMAFGLYIQKVFLPQVKIE